MDTSEIGGEGLVLPQPTLAAQYLRKSTDHQKYSTENQREVIGAYAAAHSMEVVRTYSDEGISGLTFEKRNALKQLILDVQAGQVPFGVILVYDVSRWGRYQDVDESAYYEFICRRAGVAVHYCAEQFANDGSTVAALIKGLKRVMAGEYSRELSTRVFAGQTRLASRGYMLGGFAGYGLSRLLVDQNGTPKYTLAYGERKSLATDRVLLVPGDPDQIAIVRLIFSMFVRDRMSERQIADVLNKRGIKSGYGHAWRQTVVLRILSNEKYIGNNVWNRNSCKLQTRIRRNDPALWVRAEGALPAIVDPDMFEAAQGILKTRGKTTTVGRPRNLSNEEMLRRLQGLFRKHGYLSRPLIDKNHDLPSSEAYFRRFGGLKIAFESVGAPYRWGQGFTRSGRPRGLSNDEMLAGLRQLWKERGDLTEEIIQQSKAVPGVAAYFTRFGSLLRAYQLIGFVPDSRRIRPRRIAPNTPDEVLLDSLRDLLRRYGRLSKTIINACGTGPSHTAIVSRFGGLLRAYKLIGYEAGWYRERIVRPRDLSDRDMLRALRRLLRERGRLSQELLTEAKWLPSYHEYCRRFGTLTQAYDLIGYSHRGLRLRP